MEGVKIEGQTLDNKVAGKKGEEDFERQHQQNIVDLIAKYTSDLPPQEANTGRAEITKIYNSTRAAKEATASYMGYITITIKRQVNDLLDEKYGFPIKFNPILPQPEKATDKQTGLLNTLYNYVIGLFKSPEQKLASYTNSTE